MANVGKGGDATPKIYVRLTVQTRSEYRIPIKFVQSTRMKNRDEDRKDMGCEELGIVVERQRPTRKL